jgi:type VI secretion system protein ImpK
MRAPNVPVHGPSSDDDATLFGAPPDVDPDATQLMPRPGAQASPAVSADAAGGADPDATILVPRPGAPAAGVDADATLRMPRPGGAAAAADAEATLRMPAPAGRPTLVIAPPAAAAQPTVTLQRLVAGINPLLGAASVLLALVPRLRSTSAHADPAGLRRELLERVAEFEAVASAQGVARPKISAARYLLCTFLDETIAATPWGAAGVWAERNLLQEFHDERSGAQKSFALIERLAREPAGHEDVLELAFVCLTLGFEGRFHGAADGRAQLDALAGRLLALLRPQGAPAASARMLSLRWQAAAHAARASLPGLPLPALLAVSAALVVAGLLALQARLDDAVRPVFRRIAAVPSVLQAPAAAAPVARARLAPQLQSDVAAGTIAVRDEPLRSVVTLPADALFEPGGARVEPAREALLGRVSQALASVPGQVAVVGHGDDAHAPSLRFPSGWHLTHERARAVVSRLAQQGLPAERLQAEGRADAQPVASNATPEGRARNRRIEIELRLPRPDQAP